jgi:hypothetical protein
MKIIWQSVNYKREDVRSVYAILYKNGEVEFFDVNLKGETIREWYCLKSELENTDELIEGIKVLWSGLTYQERQAAIKRKPGV